MFNKASTQWNPYTIPATPTITNDDVYSLTCSNGAVATKNPSQFLSWRKTGLPNESNLGDILYWNPESGEEGEWVILPAPEGDGLKVLASNGGAPFWNATEDCEE